MSGLGNARVRVMALGGVIVVLLGAGLWVALSHASAQPTASGPARHQVSGHPSQPVAPLRVVSVTPAQDARDVNGAAPIKVQFSAALAADTPMPRLKPRIAGSWQRAGADAVQFMPARGFGQWLHARLRIPGGAAGVRSAAGGVVASSRTVRFQVGGYSRARLAQLLAQLGYLPLKWAPAAGQTAPQLGASTGQLSAAFAPPSGRFHWKRGYPAKLKTFWDRGSPSGLIVHGAVMAFESDHGMTMDGVAGAAVWKALLAAAARDERNKHGYSYALASEHLPETLTVWHDGRQILHTAANTGIPAAPTTIGTAAVYLRYTFQIMKGTNPDGTKYADPVSWVSYFRSGEAVHYFPRGSYGYEQSLGCVELPYDQAKYVWPYMTYGTLVTVAGP